MEKIEFPGELPKIRSTGAPSDRLFLPDEVIEESLPNDYGRRTLVDEIGGRLHSHYNWQDIEIGDKIFDGKRFVYKLLPNFHLSEEIDLRDGRFSYEKLGNRVPEITFDEFRKKYPEEFCESYAEMLILFCLTNDGDRGIKSDGRGKKIKFYKNGAFNIYDLKFAHISFEDLTLIKLRNLIKNMEGSLKHDLVKRNRRKMTEEEYEITKKMAVEYAKQKLNYLINFYLSSEGVEHFKAILPASHFIKTENMTVSEYQKKCYMDFIQALSNLQSLL